MNVTFEEVFNTLCRAQQDPEAVRVFERLGVGTRRVVQHLVYMDYFDHGISFLLNEELCVSSIFFFSEGRHQQHRGFVGLLPGNLKFGSSRAEVRSVFDQLIACDEGGSEMFNITMQAWDKFAYRGNTIHIEYSGTGRTVGMVTVACEKGEIESVPDEGSNDGGLMNLLRRWFKPKTPMGLRGIGDK